MAPRGRVSGTSRWASASGDRRSRPGRHPRPRRAGAGLRRRGAARPRPRHWSPPTTPASPGSRTARSTRTSPRPTPGQSAVRRRAAGRGRVEQPHRRRGVAPPRRDCRRDRPQLRGARGLGRVAGADAAHGDPGRLRRRDRGRDAGASRRGRPCRDRRRRCRGRHLVRLVRDGRGGDRRRQLEGHPRFAATDDIATADGRDGAGRWVRLCGVGGRRRSDIDAAAIGREAADKARVPPTPSRWSPATGRSCSRSTRSSTCWRCSATSGSQRPRGPGGALVLEPGKKVGSDARHDRR